MKFSKPKRNLGNLLLLIIPIIMTPFLIKCCGGANWEYSSGQRSGVVQKISKKGIVWKTWEGELNLGYNTTSSNADGNSTIVPAIFEFSVSSEEVAEKLETAQETGKRVTIQYKQYILRGFNKGSTSYDILSVSDNTN